MEKSIVYIALGVVITFISLFIAFVYFFRNEIKRKIIGEPRKEIFTLDDLPQNLNKKKAVIGQTLLDIKTDTSKIIKSLEETKELIKESTKEIVEEVRKLTNKEVIYQNAKNGSKESAENTNFDEKNTHNQEYLPGSEQTQKQHETPASEEPITKDDLFSSTEYTEFYLNKLLPIFNQLSEEDKPNAEIVLQLMKLLDEKGECPSVVSDIEGNNFRSEKIAGRTSFDILKEINLRKHTLNVAEEILNLVEERYGQITPAVIKELVIAFAHDLGKLPDFRPKDYSMTAHPVISAKKLEEMLKNSTFDDRTKTQLIEAVEDHHKQPRNDYGKILKQADQRAREKEKRNILGDGAVISDVIVIEEKNNHLVPEKEIIQYLLEFVVNYVNKSEYFKPKQKATYFAYYIGDKVYVEPDIFYYALRENSKFQLPEIFYSDEQEDIKRAKILIANTFRALGYLDQRIGEGFHSAKFAFYGNDGSVKKTFRGMSISVEAFNEINFSRNSFPKLPSKDQIKFVKLADTQKGV